jgi:hypothetical protein
LSRKIFAQSQKNKSLFMQKVLVENPLLGYTLRMTDTARHEALANEVYELAKSIWGFKISWSILASCTIENLENQLAQLKAEEGLFNN